MNFERVISSLKQNGFEVSYFDTAADAADYLDSKIDGTTVGSGGSMTLAQMGLFERLSSHNDVASHMFKSEGKTYEQIRREERSVEIYISSVNGLAETGEIVNIDGTCNRVSDIFYGHKKVYLVVGKNKIAPDYNLALWRARNIAAPLNAKRLHRNTPCAVKGDKCYNCQSDERICKGLQVLWRKPSGCEMEVVLVNENLGY